MKTLKIVLTSILTLAVLIGGDESRIGTSGGTVSYTHLTLPTICSL